MTLNFLKIRLSQKIFLLFIVASFLPLLLGAFFSYHHSVKIINDDVLQDLKKEAKQYGLSVFFRLKIAKDALEKNSESLIVGKNTSLTQKHLSNYFSAISIKKPAGKENLFWGELDSSIYSTDITKHSNVSIIKRSKESSDVYISLNNGIYGKVNLDFLWDTQNQNTEISFCVKNELLISIFCNNYIDNHIFKNVNSSPSMDRVKSFEWDLDGEKIYSSYWQLFLDHEFNIDEWTIIASQKGSIRSNRISEFKKYFLLQIIFSLLLVILLSSTAIRKNFESINKLIDGTRKIIKNNYDNVIDIDASDEFYELAHSFNSMSKNLKGVITEYTAFANIDKSILASKQPEEVVQAIFWSLYTITSFKTVLLINTKDNMPSLAHLYHQNSKDKKIISSDTRDLILDKSVIYEKNIRILNSNDIKLKDGHPIFSIEGEFSCVIPIVHESNHWATIIVSLDHNSLSSYLEAKINSFSNKTSVAFQALHRESTLNYQANYDLLTNIPNRAKVIKLFKRNEDSIKNGQVVSAFLFLDLDRFKFVNDNYGHTVGDKLLQSFSQKVQTILADNHKIARLGGDEFAIIINAKNRESLLTEIHTLCKKVIIICKQPFKIDSHVLHIGTSIGVSLTPEHSISFEETLRYSDIAMYFSKRKGGNCYSIYKPSMSEKLRKKDELERDLITALHRKQFEIYYQVKVDADTHKHVGFEALFRWHHDTYGSIPTIDVINMAEEIDVINDLGQLVFELSLEQWQTWLAKGYNPGTLAVNVSPIQLTQPNFVNFIKSTIAKFPLIQSNMIEIEITENVMLEKKEDSLKVLHQLHALGLSIAIDDFGTGYSSLSYLLDIPANILKIDRAFILKIEQDNNAVELLSALINLGKNMGYKIVIEGVETNNQIKILNKCDVDQFQGYLFSKPLSAKLIEGRFLSPI